MTENVGKIEYVATIDFQQFVDGQRQIEGRLGQLEASGAKLEGTMTKVAGAIKTLLTVTAVTAAIKEVVTAAGKFESTLADVSAITGATGKDLKRLSDEAKNLAKTTTASSGEVLQGMKTIASAKPELLETEGALAAVTASAIKLAEAAGMDLPQAADIVATSLNQFGESASSAEKFVNVLAAGAKFGASEINETGIALKNTAVSAKAAGLSFEETNAAIQALAAAGIKGGEAGTSLRNVILKLENSTSKELKPSINGLAGALANLDKQNMSSTALTKLFGLENVNAAQALLGSSDAIKKLTGQLTGTNTAQEQATVNTATYEAAMKKMGNAVELAAIKVGDLLLPSLTAAAKTMHDLAVEFVDGSERMDKALRIAGDAAAVLAGIIGGRVYVALAGFIATMGTAVTAMGAGAVAARAFGAALTLMGGPIGIAITALALIALNWDNISGAAKTAAQISEESAERIARAVKKGGSAAKGDLEAQLKEAQKLAGEMRGRVVNLKVGTYGKGTKDEIADYEDRAKTAEAAVLNLKAAIAKLDPGGGRGFVNPETVDPEKSTQGTDPAIKTPDEPDKKKKYKFDAEAYIYALKKRSLDELDVIDATEKEEQRIRADNLKAGNITQAQSEEASTAIIAAAAAERDKISQRLFDAEVARNAQERADRIALAEEQKAAEQKEADDKAQQQSTAQGIIGEADPVAKLQFELEAKSALLAEYAAKDQENLMLYAQARVALEQDTQAKIAAVVKETRDKEAAINSARLQDSAALFEGLASMTATFAGKQSGAYKALFAVSKAFAIADAAIKIQQSIASAMSAPWPANLGFAAAAVASGAGILSSISSTSFGGKLHGGQVGGGPQPVRINENGRPEMYTSATGDQYMLPNKRGKVTSNRDLGLNADKDGAGSQNVGPMNIQLTGVQMPGGYFMMKPADLAAGLEKARRDMFL